MSKELGKQTKVLLMGGDINKLNDLTIFSDIRVTRKWFDALNVGDIIGCHQSIKTEKFKPTEETYPEIGPFITKLLVTKIDLYPSLDQAVDKSYQSNPVVLNGGTREELKKLIIDIYPTTALERAENDLKDGYTVTTFRVAS